MKYFIVFLFALVAVCSAAGECKFMVEEHNGEPETNQTTLGDETMRMQTRTVWDADCISRSVDIGVFFNNYNGSSSLMLQSSVLTINMSGLFGDLDIDGLTGREDIDYNQTTGEDDWDFSNDTDIDWDTDNGTLPDGGIETTGEILTATFTHFFRWVDVDEDGSFTKADKIVGFEEFPPLKFAENEVLGEGDEGVQGNGGNKKPSVTKITIVAEDETDLVPALTAECYFADGQGWVHQHRVSGSSSKCDLTLTNLDKLGLASNEYVGIASVIMGMNFDFGKANDLFDDEEFESEDDFLGINFNENNFEWVRTCEAGGENHTVDSLMLTIEESVAMMDFNSEREDIYNGTVDFDLDSDVNSTIAAAGGVPGTPFRMTYFTFGPHQHESIFWDPTFGSVNTVFEDKWEEINGTNPAAALNPAAAALLVAVLFALLF